MDDEIELRLIEPGDRVAGFSVGDPEFLPLKIFLKKKAKTYQEQSFARTYGAFTKGKIVAYSTLICGEILTEVATDVLGAEGQFEYKTFPAVKIARLAVDSGFRGRKLGEMMVDLSVGIVKNAIMPHVGCRFVVVDSKRSAIGFYEKAGFTLLDTESNKALEQPVLFLDLLKA